ncbi:MAG TPA: ATP-binding protein [Spirochaetia bacterium]|nr:ATP-binding protein [Spirochaetia bacterium]
MTMTAAQMRLLERFARRAGRGIHRFDMIGAGDRVLIGVSGGKDSLALTLALIERKKWVPVDYELFGAQVEWREHPLSPTERSVIDEFYADLGVPFRRITASICPPTFKKKFSCYTCSRNRKRLLFDEAARIGANRIALGHHLDDIARTTLMNLLFRGEFSTMMPVQQFFGGSLSIIRPLCEVREAEVGRLADRLGLPIVPARCPNVEKNQRLLMKEILRQASRVDRHAATNVYGAAWRIRPDYLPGSVGPA